jgi:hypothetical protein
MKGAHRKTLAAIFARPSLGNIKWSDIEALFRGLGGDVSEGAGRRVRVALNGVRAVFHRPHPQKETKRYAVENARDFLEAAGIKPEKGLER